MMAGAGAHGAAIAAAGRFRTLLQAMAHPGRIVTLAARGGPPPLGPAAAAVVTTLVDATTAVHLAGNHDTADIRDWFALKTGAPIAPPDAAAFGVGAFAALGPFGTYPQGTPAYPDRSATLVAEVERLENDGAALTGPGIEERARLSLPDPAAFARNHARFPLGLDVILTCGDRLAAIPRSTRVEA